ncbi:uncharacterized protein IUM83_13616 [Phytophthora cinnamomi]|uniref:uncharacterized protein n=1 Tax=Phytophthora cinnamomi TaxID=4785 RepID=UPI00355A8F96|nr:hypothetical protein IUM83_13616 [Phytophthora cinnamomi]
MVKTQVPRDTKTEPATAPSTTTTEAPDDQVQHKLRTQKQTDATRTNGIKARRNNKIKVSAHKVGHAINVLETVEARLMSWTTRSQPQWRHWTRLRVMIARRRRRR